MKLLADNKNKNKKKIVGTYTRKFVKYMLKIK